MDEKNDTMPKSGDGVVRRMLEYLDEFLQNNPISLLFLVIAFGYILGEIKIRGFELGSVAGVLLVGLIFGRFQYEINPTVQTLGFTLAAAQAAISSGQIEPPESLLKAARLKCYFLKETSFSNGNLTYAVVY